MSKSRPKTCLGSRFLAKIKCNELMNPHSIQNNKILDFISNGSQTLLHRRFDVDSVLKNDLILFEKQGRKQATTFGGGMCGIHDQLLFDCIEQQEIDITNKKQLLVFAIRSCLKEIYTKIHALNVSKNNPSEVPASPIVPKATSFPLFENCLKPSSSLLSLYIFEDSANPSKRGIWLPIEGRSEEEFFNFTSSFQLPS